MLALFNGHCSFTCSTTLQEENTVLILTILALIFIRRFLWLVLLYVVLGKLVFWLHQRVILPWVNPGAIIEPMRWPLCPINWKTEYFRFKHERGFLAWLNMVVGTFVVKAIALVVWVADPLILVVVWIFFIPARLFTKVIEANETRIRMRHPMNS